MGMRQTIEEALQLCCTLRNIKLTDEEARWLGREVAIVLNTDNLKWRDQRNIEAIVAAYVTRMEILDEDPARTLNNLLDATPAIPYAFQKAIQQIGARIWAHGYKAGTAHAHAHAQSDPLDAAPKPTPTPVAPSSEDAAFIKAAEQGIITFLRSQLDTYEANDRAISKAGGRRPTGMDFITDMRDMLSRLEKP
jgi:hypothetical protein